VLVIDAEMFSKICDCHDRQGLTIAQTARALGLHWRTVAKWLARSQFEPRRSRLRHSILDPFKPHITKLLHDYPYSVRQVSLRLHQKGYSGGLSILGDYIRRIRPDKSSPKPRRQSVCWTRAQVKEIASTCSTISQFRKLHGTAYNYALKKGWMPEICPHLPFVGRTSSSYTLRLEHTRHQRLDINIRKSSEKPSFVLPANLRIDAKDVRPNWSRDFSIPGKYTLEQLCDIILSLLGWERNHRYKFQIANCVYANLVLLEEDDFIVDIDYPCVSCDIALKDVGLTIGDNFTLIFDFAAHHVFQLTVLDIRPASLAPKIMPSLISCRGTNIVQYPGIVSKSQKQTFKNRIPKILTLALIGAVFASSDVRMRPY
jgi:hypothetical protein